MNVIPLSLSNTSDYMLEKSSATQEERSVRIMENLLYTRCAQTKFKDRQLIQLFSGLKNLRSILFSY